MGFISLFPTHCATLYHSNLSNALLHDKKSYTSSLRMMVSKTNNNNFKFRVSNIALQDGLLQELTQNVMATDDEDLDLDHPTQGFDSISDAIEDIRLGKMVIVVDDENRKNEGDLIMAAELVTPDAMAFFVKHGTGIVCVSMTEDDLKRLQLPQMVDSKLNLDKLRTAFTITVDAKHGTTTGVSAEDRATTVKALASKESKVEDFNRPGHIFPLRYTKGGVLNRPGHTEASVDLSVLAGLGPVGVICEIVDHDDGSMARLPRLREFARKEKIKLVSIADLIRYRRKREKLVERFSSAKIPTMAGLFQAYCYKSILDGCEHIAMVKGEIGDGKEILVRVHTECITGDILSSTTCHCGKQLELAMKRIEEDGRGIVVYLRGHEGRGIGIGHTFQENQDLGSLADSKDYGIAAKILQDLGVTTMKLMTNYPAKYVGIKEYGLTVSGRVPLIITPITLHNHR